MQPSDRILGQPDTEKLEAASGESIDSGCVIGKPESSGKQLLRRQNLPVRQRTAVRNQPLKTSLPARFPIHRMNQAGIVEIVHLPLQTIIPGKHQIADQILCRKKHPSEKPPLPIPAIRLENGEMADFCRRRDPGKEQRTRLIPGDAVCRLTHKCALRTGNAGISGRVIKSPGKFSGQMIKNGTIEYTPITPLAAEKFISLKTRGNQTEVSRLPHPFQLKTIHSLQPFFDSINPVKYRIPTQ